MILTSMAEQNAKIHEQKRVNITDSLELFKPHFCIKKHVNSNSTDYGFPFSASEEL
jgi:hypothetical protein